MAVRRCPRATHGWALDSSGHTHLRAHGGWTISPEQYCDDVRRFDEKWLTPEAFRLWRNTGLRSFTVDGLPGARWRGLTEDRDVAFVEGLFGTGLRLSEWASQLTIELPEFTPEGLFRGRLAAACAKRSVGRRFWMRRPLTRVRITQPA